MLLSVIYSRVTVQAFFDRSNILSISASTYYRHLKKLVYPVIWTYWLMEQARNIEEVMVIAAFEHVMGNSELNHIETETQLETYS